MKFESYFDLLILHRTILEAKFSDEPNDVDVSMSPLVAKMSNQIIDELINSLRQDGNLEEANTWCEWRSSLNDRPREIKIIKSNIERLINDGTWGDLDDEEKKGAITEFASPFFIVEEQINSLLQE